MADELLTPERYTSVLKAETYRRFGFRGRSAAELQVWQRTFRPRLREALGLNVMAEREPAQPEPVRLGREVLDDHIREEWTIATEPGFRLPFYLLRPLEAEGPHPLVLAVHGHNKGAKATYAGIAADEQERKSIAEGERDIALQAVREGFVAIAPDMRGFGGLRRREDIEQDRNCSCQELHKHALLFGRTLIGERVWDVGKLIDYAAGRRDIDTGRSMITGNSGGGTVSLFAAACDVRISVCVPGSYFCTFEDSIGSRPHCPCNFVPGLLRMAEMYDVAGLIADRPFLAVNGRQDEIFPIEATRRAYQALRGIYEVAGAADRCRLFEGHQGHRYYKEPVWAFAHEFL